MSVPYFNSHPLNLDAQKASGPAVSDSGSVLNGCSQRNGLAFGLEVQQTAPNNYLNTSGPCGESFHNPFSDYRFPQVLVRALYHQGPGRIVPLGLTNKTKAQQSDEDILYTGQSGLRIDHVWNMAVKANSQSHSINANHSPLASTLKDTAGNGSSGMGRSTPQRSSVVDNTSQKACERSRKRKASRKAYEQSEKGKAVRKAYRQSDAGKASCKAYEQSERGKAVRKAYEQTEKRKAFHKAYHKSNKCKAYEQSEKRKAYKRAYHKAYHRVFKNTGDREQAKIAAKQAAALINKIE